MSAITPPRRATPRTSRAASLAKGFDALNLDPTPRLRATRKQMERDPLQRRDPWRGVREAMSTALKGTSPNR